MILKFSSNIIRKEWKTLLLPFLSILLTGAVITTSFLLINSARDFITSKNKEFLGGDISYSSSKEYDINNLIMAARVERISKQITFSGLLQTGFENNIEENIQSVGASFKIIDDSYPLYGSVDLLGGNFDRLQPNEIYVDENLSKSLATNTVYFNNQAFIVKGVVRNSPENLLSGFSFTGTLLMSPEGLARSRVDLNLFRKEFITKVRLNEKLTKSEVEVLRQKARDQNVRGQFDGSGAGGISFGLDIVERFLVITILVISILSLVNIYASVNYLANRLRRSFAVLIAIGLNLTSIYKILFLINSSVIFLGTSIGIFIGYYVSYLIGLFVEVNFGLGMFVGVNYTELLLVFSVIFITSIFATLPVINRLRGVSPRELLSHGEKSNNKRTVLNIIFDIIVGILPVTLAAIYLLDNVWFGLFAMLGIICVYGGLMLFYYFFVNVIYRFRGSMPFSLKLITAQKKFDGFFGLITFASLFVALASVYNLSIIRSSIEDFLKKDLTRSLPSTYILDVQSSQREQLLSVFPDAILFPNVRARMTEIDGVNIQKALADKNSEMDRELGREFNLTYRDRLLANEKLIDGDLSGIGVGEVSIEKSFAERVNIKMGSSLKFIIQGFVIEVKVTSIREADMRSGLPFFFLVFSEEELGGFPTTFFGYANYDTQKQDDLRNYLAENLPNVSILDTSAIVKIGGDLISVLLLIILIITIPPIILSSMLIVTILASLSKDRKRDGARLMALGKANKYVRNFYIIESTSAVVLASGFAYIFAVLLSNFVIIKYLDIDNIVYFDIISFYIFITILLGITLVSVFLWRKGNKSLKEYLNYEDNN